MVISSRPLPREMSCPPQHPAAPLDFSSRNGLCSTWFSRFHAKTKTVTDDGVTGPGHGSVGSALDELQRPVTILVGPAGSGKTERILAMERPIVPPFGKKPSGAARRSAVV